MNVRLVPALAALITLGAISAHAVPIVGFGNLALSGGSVETFDEVTDGGDANPFATFTTTNGITITANDVFTIGPDYIGEYDDYGVNSLYNGPYGYEQNNTWAFTFDFASPVDSFAFNLGASDDVWTLSAFNSSNALIESLVIPPTGSSDAGDYFGLADSGIAYATLSDNSGNNGDWVFIDNLTIPGGSSVPDVGSTALILSGVIAAMAGYSRRKRA